MIKSRRHLDLLLFAALAAVFVSMPQIDLWISGLAFDDEQGFFLRDEPWVRFIYRSVNVLVPPLLIGLALLTLLGWLWRRGAPGRYRLQASYLLLLLLLGPGVLVNSVLKDHWGRARPAQVAEFGGEHQFTRAFVIDDACASNCSFVSGHASAGFYLIGLFFLRRRRIWLWASLGVGGAIGAVRIIQGGHFASDVVFSFAAVYLVAKLLYWLMFIRPAKPVAKVCAGE